MRSRRSSGRRSRLGRSRARPPDRPGRSAPASSFPDGWMRRRTGGAVGSLPVRTMTRPYEPSPTRPMKRTRRGGVGLAAPRPAWSRFTSAAARPAALTERPKFGPNGRYPRPSGASGPAPSCRRQPADTLAAREGHRAGRRAVLREVNAVHGADARRFARRPGQRRGRVRPDPRLAGAHRDGAFEEDRRRPGAVRRRAGRGLVARRASRSSGRSRRSPW